VALIRAEATLPTCNLSSFTVEPPGNLPNLPTAASARLDFQLVPAQHPDTIINLVREQLIARGILDVTVERLPGGYPPTRTEPEHPFVQHVCAAGIPICGEPFVLLPLGPFTQPLHTFASHLGTPVAVVALKRNDSAVHGPNEHLPLEDLLQHGQLLIELASACAGQTSSVGQDSAGRQ
jgi:acetylornithine deacetylase/succinyl-diaminopimelate desuccinylase-like protein